MNEKDMVLNLQTLDDPAMDIQPASTITTVTITTTTIAVSTASNHCSAISVAC